MINTGTSFLMPCESGYSLIRSLYQANLTQTFSNAELVFELECKVGKRLELSIFSRSSYLERIHLLLNKYIKSTKKLNKKVLYLGNFSSKETNFINSYRPIKHCSECSKLGYHCYLYDYSWVIKCPIHNSELLEYCPDCEGAWPTNAKLKKRICFTCGLSPKFKSFKNANKLLIPHSRLRYYLEKLKKIKFPEVKIWQVNTWLNYYRENINEQSELYLNSLMKVGYKPEVVSKILTGFGIKKSCVETKVFNLPEFNCFQSEGCKYIFSAYKSEINKRVSCKVIDELSKRSSGHHCMGDCVCSEGLCSICAIWFFWLVISKDYKSYIDSLEFFAFEKRVQYMLTKMPFFQMKNKPMNLSVKKGNINISFSVPDALMSFIYEIDLRYLVNKLFEVMLEGNKEDFSVQRWEDIYLKIREIIRGSIKDAPHLLIQEHDRKLTVFYDIDSFS